MTCFYAKAILDELWGERHNPEDIEEATEGLRKILRKLEDKRSPNSFWERAKAEDYHDWRRHLRLPEDLPDEDLQHLKNFVRPEIATQTS